MHTEELLNLFPSPNIISDQIENDEMAGRCSTHGKDEKYITKFWSENLNGKFVVG